MNIYNRLLVSTVAAMMYPSNLMSYRRPIPRRDPWNEWNRREERLTQAIHLGFADLLSEWLEQSSGIYSLQVMRCGMFIDSSESWTFSAIVSKAFVCRRKSLAEIHILILIEKMINRQKSEILTSTEICLTSHTLTHRLEHFDKLVRNENLGIQCSLWSSAMMMMVFHHSTLFEQRINTKTSDDDR